MEDTANRKNQIHTIVLFMMLIISVSFFLVTLLAIRSNSIYKNSTLDLLSSHDEQVRANTDHYFEDVLNDAAFLYGEKDLLDYDPASSDDSVKEALKERLDETGVNNNYRDVAIVFDNDEVLGRMSSTTEEMFDKGTIYETLSDTLGDNDEVWEGDLADNKNRLYYLKKFNDHGILMISYEKSLFEELYTVPEEVKGVQISLVDPDGTIVYASSSGTINTRYDSSSFSLVKGIEQGMILNEHVYYMSDTCANGMYVITSVAASDLIASNRNAYLMTLIVMAAMIVVIVVYSLFRIRKMYAGTDAIVGSLKSEAEHDQMTGLYTKTHFAVQADTCMKGRGPANNYSRCTFTIFDLDNFKSINDGYGHIAGDDVIREFARLLKECFDDKKYTIGRLGGDEFGIIGCFDIWDDDTLIREINQRLWRLRYEFSTSEVGKRYGIPLLSFSSGTVISKEDEKTFNELYKRADTLLYNGKKTGKGKDINEVTEKKS